MSRISPRERESVLRSLSSGVVPAIGLHHIQVGRLEEVNAMIQDLDQVERGGTFVRFIVGRYGSGKTFFLHLLKNVALQRKFVVLEADITTDRRLHGSGGKGRAIYTELMRNLATRSKPEGGALSNPIERWASDIDHSVRSQGGDDEPVKKAFAKSPRPLQEFGPGSDFNPASTHTSTGETLHTTPPSTPSRPRGPRKAGLSRFPPGCRRGRQKVAAAWAASWWLCCRARCRLVLRLRRPDPARTAEPGPCQATHWQRWRISCPTQSGCTGERTSLQLCKTKFG